MIKKEDYLKAKSIVKEYQEQIDLPFLEKGTDCYVMYRTSDNVTFVLTDEEHADKLYDTGEYVLIKTKLL